MIRVKCCNFLNLYGRYILQHESFLTMYPLSVLANTPYKSLSQCMFLIVLRRKPVCPVITQLTAEQSVFISEPFSPQIFESLCIKNIPIQRFKKTKKHYVVTGSVRKRVYTPIHFSRTLPLKHIIKICSNHVYFGKELLI